MYKLDQKALEKGKSLINLDRPCHLFFDGAS